jgi:hypothetical protein
MHPVKEKAKMKLEPIIEVLKKIRIKQTDQRIDFDLYMRVEVEVETYVRHRIPTSSLYRYMEGERKKLK